MGRGYSEQVNMQFLKLCFTTHFILRAEPPFAFFLIEACHNPVRPEKSPQPGLLDESIFHSFVSLVHSFFCKNIFYKNIEAEICEILGIF